MKNYIYGFLTAAFIFIIIINFHPSKVKAENEIINAINSRIKFLVGEESISQKTFHNGISEVPLTLLYQGTTYVPIRFFSEMLGNNVEWDSNSRTIIINKIEQKTTNSWSKDTVVDGIYGIAIDQHKSEVINRLGEPLETQKSPFNYEWLIFKGQDNRYIQIGVNNNDRVVAIYTNDKYWTWNEYSNKSTFKDIQSKIKLIQEEGTNKYKFTSNHNNLHIEWYFDGETELLNSIRISKSDINNNPSWDEKTLEDQEKQIAFLTNNLRIKNNLSTLEWNNQVAAIAKEHSTDMANSGYFSHTSLNNKSIADRFTIKGIQYKSIGENIAYGHSDAIEVVEAWLNSYSHRLNLLHTDYKYVGIGIKGQHYTQNFMR